jgi:hypothetical protein
LATRYDLGVLRNDVDVVRRALEAKIEAVRRELETKIDALRRDLGAKIDAVRSDLQVKIDTLSMRLTIRMGGDDRCRGGGIGRNHQALRLGHRSSGKSDSAGDDRRIGIMGHERRAAPRCGFGH